MKKSDTRSYKKYLTIGVFSLTSIIVGILYAAGGPLGYTLCAVEGATCTLNGSTDLAYGANGTFSYKTVPNGTTSISCNNTTFGGDPLFGVEKSCYKKIVIANLPWLNPQGVAIGESQNDGFLVLSGQTKQVSVHSDCKNIAAPALKNVYVPTKTLGEWTAFKANASANLGVIITNCGGPINGVCSTPPTFCSAGTKISDNNNTTPGQNRLWICQGSGGGSNSPQCSYTNPVVSCVPNGSYTYGSCSVSCGGGTQDRYDSCGDYYDTVNTNCNPGACTCTPTSYSAWGACSASCGGGTQTRTDNCGNTENQACNTQSCPTTGPYTYGAWSACSASCGGGTQTRTETCSYDTCTGQQATSQACNTQSCGPVCNWTNITPVCGILEALPVQEEELCTPGNIGTVITYSHIPVGSCGGGKSLLQTVRCDCN